MPVQDYLADTEAVDSNDPYAGAIAAGRARGNADVGILPPPKTPLRSRAPAAVKPVDPLDDSRYKQAALARRELQQNETLYHQRLKDFDATEGAALKWKTVPGELPGDDPHAVASGPAQTALMDTVNNSPGSPENVAATRRMQLLSEKRQRLADEANRITHNRIQFDQQTFMPLRDSLMSGAQQSSSAPAAPALSAADYLAPEGDTPLNNRIADVNARRQRMGQPPIAPGSVSAGNFTENWGPLDRRTPTQDQPETGYAGQPDFSPQNNPPGDESRGGEDAPVPDALDDTAIEARHAAMADDLKSQFARGSPMDRLKMMFGSKGYGTNEVEEAPPMIGSEAGGTTGTAFTIPKMKGAGMLAGAVNAANKFTSALTTPENASIMATTGGAGALAEIGGAVGKAAQIAKAAALGGFTAQMAAGVPEQVKDAYAVLNDPKSTDAQKAEAVVTPGLNTFMAALAAHGTVNEAKGIPGAGGETPPDFNDQGGRFRPIGPDQPAQPPSPEPPVDSTAVTPKVEPPSEAPAPPANGEPPNALPIQSPSSILQREPLQTREPGGERGRVESGQQRAEATQAGEGEAGEATAPGQTTESAGLSGGGGEPPPVEPISSETQPTSENSGETSNELPPLGQPQQPGLSEQPGESAIPTRDGLDPNGRVIDSGTVQPGPVRPDRGRGGEQPRGNQGDGPELPGAVSPGAANPDVGLAGDAGRPVSETSASPPEQSAADAQAAREKSDAADRELLADQPVKLKARRASDGAEMDVELGAKDAEKMLTDRHNVLRMVLDCLGR